MRLEPNTDGWSHDAIAVDVDAHHPRPATVDFSDIATSVLGGSDFNLDVILPDAGFTYAQITMTGPKRSAFATALWRECAIVHATDTASEAIGHSSRSTGTNYKSYLVTYAKSVGVTNLTHKIFDSNTGQSNRYIALKDARIIGTTLRLTFHNYLGSAQTLWVKGQALVY